LGVAIASAAGIRKNAFIFGANSHAVFNSGDITVLGGGQNAATFVRVGSTLTITPFYVEGETVLV
jgi:hypothetical protein